MVDRVSASITIGGRLPAEFLPEFLELLAEEDLSLDWDGEPFTAAQLVCGLPLHLRGTEVAQGQFSRLEDFCVARDLPFRRWCGGCYSWGPQRAVFDGTGEVNYYATDEEDRIVVCREIIEDLGDFESVLAWFDAADMRVPPLVPEGGTVPESTAPPPCLIKVRRLVPIGDLDAEDRGVLPFYAVAFGCSATVLSLDEADRIEMATDIFHRAVAIGNLDHFAIMVTVVAGHGAVPSRAVWLTQEDSLLPSLPANKEHEHG